MTIRVDAVVTLPFGKSLHLPFRFCSLKLLGHSWNLRAALSTSSVRGDLLYRRISPIGDPNVSVVPVLDQWIEDGKSVKKRQVQAIIKELQFYRRFKHALQTSFWMTDKRYFHLSSEDVASRLKLILRVHGIDEVENYFNNTHIKLKRYDVYTALLSCYCEAKRVEKAEDLMQKLRTMGYANSSFCYNIMMDLYRKMENWQKLDEFMHEMEGKGIAGDDLTYSIRLRAYGDASDVEGIDQTLAKIEKADSRPVLDYHTYATAGDAYLRVGSVDKALEVLRKAERLIGTTTKKNEAYNFLLKLYAAAGKKEEVYRIWSHYKRCQQIHNRAYAEMIGGLVSLDDIEGAEKFLEEWESTKPNYDFRIPNLLIKYYCGNGCLEKAEALLNKGIAKGGDPLARTWYYLACVYIEDNHISKALDALRKLSSLKKPPEWKLSEELVAHCISYMEGKGDQNGAEDFISSLEAEDAFSASARERLVSFIKDGIQCSAAAEGTA